jgi:glycosyltransferase involved in cell wall biosynthesis
MPDKKKVFYHSDFSLLKTGFGRVARLILSHLHKTGKYDIVQFCCGLTDNNPVYSRLPWRCIGALPSDPRELQNIQRDPKLAQLSSYGAHRIDQAICDEKPDVYMAVQDIWGVDFAANKKWFPKENALIWTTLDSLPILPAAIEVAKKTDNFWVWSDFATKALNKMGHKHVKTMHGPLDDSVFTRLDDRQRLQLRKRCGLSSSNFVVGFVFRNQLRKSVPNLLEGYKIFKDQNKEKLKDNGRLLLHTNFSEGWNIHRLADEIGVDRKEILTTYFCSKCHSYVIHTYEQPQVNCPLCGEEKGMTTIDIQKGPTESQLNEIYNMMDVYCHPFTSGGQEVPIQEAKLTELITLVTSYSCGEEMCYPEANSLPLDWSEYREHNTEFIKASTKVESIAEQLTKVYNMPLDERLEMGKKARQWTVDNFSISKIGKIFEDFIDSRPDLDKSVYVVKSTKNPDADIDSGLPDKEWITSLYDKILDMKVDDADQGYQYWIKEIEKGLSRKDILNYFKGIAEKEVMSEKGIEDYLDKDDGDKRILYVIPESAGDVYMATSLFPNLKKQYPNYNLYVATKMQYAAIIEGNPHVHKVIPYIPKMDSIHYLEGGQGHKGLFEVALLSHVNAQRVSCYTHNGLDKIAFDLLDTV